jgi:hypothetical protein
MPQRSDKDREEDYPSVSRRRRTQRDLADERGRWTRFEDLTHKLLKVSKKELDEKREEEKRPGQKDD